MKRTFTLILVLFCFKAIAQCPSTGIVSLEDQADVDNYFANGGCSVVQHLIIGDGSPNILNLNGLNGITTVTGFMFVGWGPLVDFTGMETLTSVDTLAIEWSPSLKNFKGLENVLTINHLSINELSSLESFDGLGQATVTGSIYIAGCHSLTSIDDLNIPASLPDGLIIGDCPLLDDFSSFANLQSTSRLIISRLDKMQDCQWLNSLEVATQLNIEANANLTSLKGLENLHTVEQIQITYNPLLTSIDGMGNIKSQLSRFVVLFNPELSDCAIDAVCWMLLDSAPEEIFLYQNKGICSNTDLLKSACKESLPVTLLSFDAVLENKVVNLNWTTSEEENSEKFEVQHSTNGKQWSVVGEVKSSGIGGLGAVYQFIHLTPSDRNNYYRLKMIDFDQTYALSTISHVYFNGNIETVYPNPTSGSINIVSTDPSEIAAFELINSKGNIVMKRRGNLADRINLEKFSSGSYTLRIIKNNSTSSNHKIVVTK
ncbi:T9SS type A sorting domain-containing protein [Dyadobacter chenhuakuii]|uniref:T9SS type A sorting domain-containing protein n=1 Tax=Dyadobacter chenhuakuii TaxID=2909339 RepID=A0ABY4XNM3_9BACT|nr:T9SS type A sorting domain-containing protein [Dyadobacter chenhuakuii]MCF2494628.1 T9SS type A sorting domain-containing protein [Dyadobacter chenhuakuii]USJ32050.1 T9SS type A sorting domain-containing protein [Dyadobacter chenhuakuii]